MDDVAGIMDARGVAELLGVSPRTIKRWISMGMIPHTRLPGGRLIRFDADRVRRWFLDGCRRPQASHFYGRNRRVHKTQTRGQGAEAPASKGGTTARLEKMAQI